jgi:DNA polymerase-1
MTMESLETYKTPCLLIDADVLVHKVSRAAEVQTRWEDGVWTWHATEADGDLILSNYVESLKKRFNTEAVVMCISDKANFRHEVFPDYKKERDNPMSYAPLLKSYLRNKMLSEYESFMIPGLEADDVLGILMTTGGFKKGHQKYILTIDKDLDTVPGWHYNLDRKEVYNVSTEQADAKFYLQCLMGDRVDDIPGCPGYGEKTAEKALKGVADPWPVIVKCYEKKGLTYADALTTARLVRILHNKDWNNQTKKPILWSPDVELPKHPTTAD